MTFVDGPHTRITNPRWRTAAILEKSKDCYISAAVWAISTKFGMMMQFDPFNRSEISKIQDGGSRHLEKPKNRHISAAVQPILTKFGTLVQYDPLDSPDR